MMMLQWFSLKILKLKKNRIQRTFNACKKLRERNLFDFRIFLLKFYFLNNQIEMMKRKNVELLRIMKEINEKM